MPKSERDRALAAAASGAGLAALPQ